MPHLLTDFIPLCWLRVTSNNTVQWKPQGHSFPLFNRVWINRRLFVIHNGEDINPLFRWKMVWKSCVVPLWHAALFLILFFFLPNPSGITASAEFCRVGGIMWRSPHIASGHSWERGTQFGRQRLEHQGATGGEATSSLCASICRRLSPLITQFC